jgi:hypothetical protein
MSTGQIVIVWALFAFATMGVPGFWLGWYFGRRSLRTLLARELLPIVRHEVVVVPQPSPLRIAARMPVDESMFDTEPLLLWSQNAAAADATAREIRELTADAERRFPRYGTHR